MPLSKVLFDELPPCELLWMLLTLDVDEVSTVIGDSAGSDERLVPTFRGFGVMSSVKKYSLVSSERSRSSLRLLGVSLADSTRAMESRRAASSERVRGMGDGDAAGEN